MAEDMHRWFQAGLESPATNAAAMSENDSTDLAYTTRAIYVGGAGNVVVDMVSGQTEVTFSSVPAGTILPIRATRLRTATTATNLVALY